jgi:hypothetical protein
MHEYYQLTRGESVRTPARPCLRVRACFHQHRISFLFDFAPAPRKENRIHEMKYSGRFSVKCATRERRRTTAPNSPLINRVHRKYSAAKKGRVLRGASSIHCSSRNTAFDISASIWALIDSVGEPVLERAHRRSNILRVDSP